MHSSIQMSARRLGCWLRPARLSSRDHSVSGSNFPWKRDEDNDRMRTRTGRGQGQYEDKDRMRMRIRMKLFSLVTCGPWNGACQLPSSWRRRGWPSCSAWTGPAFQSMASNGTCSRTLQKLDNTQIIGLGTQFAHPTSKTELYKVCKCVETLD